MHRPLSCWLLLAALLPAAEVVLIRFTDGSSSYARLEALEHGLVRCQVPWQAENGRVLLPRSYPLGIVADIVELPGAELFDLVETAPAATVQVREAGPWKAWLSWDNRRRMRIGQVEDAADELRLAQAEQARLVEAIASTTDTLVAAEAALPAAHHAAELAERSRADGEAALRGAEAAMAAEAARHGFSFGGGGSALDPATLPPGFDAGVLGSYQARWQQWAAAGQALARAQQRVADLELRIAQATARLATLRAQLQALQQRLQELVAALAAAEAELAAWQEQEPPKRRQADDAP